MKTKADILKQIVARKHEEIAAAKAIIPENRLVVEAQKPIVRRPFLQRLITTKSSAINIIAEIKRASPSKGLIREHLDPAEWAQKYQQGGAACISVLTDRDYFRGSTEDFIVARQAATLPMLRKDFLVSAYQIYESAILGADACLLIVTILDPLQLKDYLVLCAELNMDALVEVHTSEELETADKAGARLIGINNRNLKTFDTDVNTAANMADRLKPDQIVVAESGIHTRADIERLALAGIRNFLIGESIVRSSDPINFIKNLTMDIQ